MSLRPLVLVLVPATALLAAPRAHADDQLAGGVLKLELKLPAEGGGDFTLPTAQYQKRFFNQARCVCDDTAPQEYQITYSWTTRPTGTPVATAVDAWAGRNCDSEMETTRDNDCNNLGVIGEPSDFDTAIEQPYSVAALMTSPNDLTCSAKFSAQHWAVVMNGTVWNVENRAKLSADVLVDMEPPAAPSTLTVNALEGAIVLDWTGFDPDDDTQFYQALCSRADGSLAHTPATSTARYDTARTLCGANADIELPAASVTNPIGDLDDALPVALERLDAAFICGEAGATANQIRLGRLDNDQGYRIVLLAVDESGNASGVRIDRPIVPREVIDFWEELNAEDGNLEGGFCVAQIGDGGGALGSAGLVAIAALIAARRRRRRGTARLARLALLGLVLAPGVASAQESFSPYWLEEEQGSEGLPMPEWNIGFRLGPYRPDIDAGFDSDPGPFARTFKKDSVMFAVDLQRLWYIGRGQAGFGFTGGYYGNSTNAFVQGSDPTDPDRPRAVGNTTSLRVVPLALTATYRATIFDDEMGIPIVPYARAGVGYYLWWIKAPSGDLSVAMSCATCEDKAIGGTLGLVAAAGIAIRAERIDGDAARSMQDSGLEHAGFFAEVEGSWIDGFGNERRLSVGDLTWFGGINFEF